jgi:hypothetical protein
MSDILAEVLDDQRVERRVRYFKKALPIIILSLIVAIIVIFIRDLHIKKLNDHNIEMGNILLKSIIDTKADEAILDAVITQTETATKEIAHLRQASIKMMKEDYASSKTLLETIINSKDYSEITIRYARLMWLSFMMNETNLSKLDEETIMRYLDYFNNEEELFFGSANIIKAIFYIKNNKLKEAKLTLERILSLQNVEAPIVWQAKTIFSTIDGL